MEILAILLLLIAAGFGVLLIVALVQSVRRGSERAKQRRRDEALRQSVNTLYAAATGSDTDTRRQLDSVDVNLQNPDGDSALHLAYYNGREDAVARLQALGADETLRNHDGLTPAEMTEVAETERLLKQTLACMTGCIWLNEKQGRPLYEALKQCPPRIYNPALVREFLRLKHHRRLVCLAVKVGMPGSDERLALMLDGHGTKEMATDFLNSGSSLLALRADEWAAAHGYRIHYTTRHAVARWGQF